ncbi:hypothetical protein EDD85DRAFT_989035 [Armillaria nabsnona]|nr:hypothetical protein EDD85DRAFT_989035 [Armillaria nabsnona]
MVESAAGGQFRTQKTLANWGQRQLLTQSWIWCRAWRRGVSQLNVRFFVSDMAVGSVLKRGEPCFNIDQAQRTGSTPTWRVVGLQREIRDRQDKYGGDLGDYEDDSSHDDFIQTARKVFTEQPIGTMLQKRVDPAEESLVFWKRKFNTLLCDNESSALSVVDFGGITGLVFGIGINTQYIDRRATTTLRVSISEDRRNQRTHYNHPDQKIPSLWLRIQSTHRRSTIVRIDGSYAGRGRQTADNMVNPQKLVKARNAAQREYPIKQRESAPLSSTEHPSVLSWSATHSATQIATVRTAMGTPTRDWESTEGCVMCEVQHKVLFHEYQFQADASLMKVMVVKEERSLRRITRSNNEDREAARLTAACRHFNPMEDSSIILSPLISSHELRASGKVAYRPTSKGLDSLYPGFRSANFLIMVTRQEVNKCVQYSSITGNVRTVAIYAGPGGSILVGRKADAYLTGEMSHVRLSPECTNTVTDSMQYRRRSLISSKCAATRNAVSFPFWLQKEIRIDELEAVLVTSIKPTLFRLLTSQEYHRVLGPSQTLFGLRFKSSNTESMTFMLFETGYVRSATVGKLSSVLDSEG